MCLLDSQTKKRRTVTAADGADGAARPRHWVSQGGTERDHTYLGGDLGRLVVTDWCAGLGKSA